MSEFKVRLNGVNGSASQNDTIARELFQISGEVYDLKRRLRFQIAQRARINRRLAEQGSTISGESQKMRRASSALKSISREYRRTESGLCGTDEKKNNGSGFIYAVIRDLPLILPTPYVPWLFVDFEAFNEKIFKNLTESEKNGNENSSDDKNSNRKFLGKETMKDSKMTDDLSDLKTEDKERVTYDIRTKKGEIIDEKDEDATKKFDDGIKDSKMDASVKIGFSDKVSAAWLDESGEIEYGILKSSGSVELVKGEAKKEGYIGLYQKDPSSGKMVFKPGVGGEIGASFSAFTAEEKVELGNDMLGVYASSTQTAGKVGAKAEGSVGLYDSKGKFNPSAYVGATAEIIAGEITAKAGGKILGTDVGVGGSLNYGIGAHANAGYKGGKFYLDVGASFGVGASAKLEIDIGGTVDAVCDGAKAAWDGVKNWFHW